MTPPHTPWTAPCHCTGRNQGLRPPACRAMSGRRGGVSMSQTRYEGLHDLPALKYKPGAPFKHWKKPPALSVLEKPLGAEPGAGSHSSRFYGPDRSTAWTRSSSLVRMRSDKAPAMLRLLDRPHTHPPPPADAPG